MLLLEEMYGNQGMSLSANLNDRYLAVLGEMRHCIILLVVCVVLSMLYIFPNVKARPKTGWQSMFIVLYPKFNVSMYYKSRKHYMTHLHCTSTAHALQLPTFP